MTGSSVNLLTANSFVFHESDSGALSCLLIWLGIFYLTSKRKSTVYLALDVPAISNI